MKYLSGFFILACALALSMAASPSVILAGSSPIPNSSFRGSANDTRADSCQLGTAWGSIQHVIVVQFDNVHLTRDNPNVPSDLEQMPHLLNFIDHNGVLLTNHHTPLISHTGTDILTILTGVYPDRNGAAVSNGYRYFLPDGTSNAAQTYTYWTDKLYDPTLPTSPTDTTYNMLTADGHNAPAPWVPFTRAGCNVGAIATANLALESFDVERIFGNPSPEYDEFLTNPDLAFTDFVGIAIHCAASSLFCSGSNHGTPDILPDEPGGYDGFNALYGARYVNPQVGGSGTDKLTLYDLFGQSIINQTSRTPGFTGFDMPPQVALAYVAYMQEHDIPITFAYIADAHDKHPGGPSFGPGEAGFVGALKAYDDAFDAFFHRLANDGIDRSNTLFVFMADEGDHFAGGAPDNSCDGVNAVCLYSHVTCPTDQLHACPSNNVGALNVNMAGLLATQQAITAPFQVHADVAPTIYSNGNPTPADPTITRPFERATSNLVATNFYTGITENLTVGLADPVEMKLLHMITADPARTPTFTWFAKDDYYVYAGGANCNSRCVQEIPSLAWTHGDVTPDITKTWLGMVGPGIKARGRDNKTWADHADVRPTILALLGLEDDYVPDGRVLFEEFRRYASPPALRASRDLARQLAKVYKKINAPVGSLGIHSLKISTRALASGDRTTDQTYTNLESRLDNITNRRDALAREMIELLQGAEFESKPINADTAKVLIARGRALLNEVIELAKQ